MRKNIIHRREREREPTLPFTTTPSRDESDGSRGNLRENQDKT